MDQENDSVVTGVTAFHDLDLRSREAFCFVMFLDFGLGQSDLMHVQRLSVFQISMTSQRCIRDAAIAYELHFTDGRCFDDFQRYDDAVGSVL